MGNGDLIYFVQNVLLREDEFKKQIVLNILMNSIFLYYINNGSNLCVQLVDKRLDIQAAMLCL